MNPNINHFIEAGVWFFAISLFLFACLKNWRKATVGFLYMQLFTWPFGIFAVEYGALEYPIRFFPETIRSSFTYEFLALPAVGALYCIYFPAGRQLFKKVRFMVAFPTLLTLGEVILIKYTDLVRYIHWNWFLTWLTVGLTLQLNYMLYRWFQLNPRSDRIR
jgi:hypothetical protein